MHQTAVKILDERKWFTRLFWADLLALGLLVAVGAALLIEMYYFGFYAHAVRTGANHLVVERDQSVIRMLAEAAIVAISFAWVAYRVVRGGYRGILEAGAR